MELPMKIVLGIIAVLVCVAFMQMRFAPDQPEKKAPKPKEKIVDKAFHTDNLSTFVSALKTAELDDELNRDTPITVFAPSDSAFAALPDGQYDKLMQSSNKEKLKNILAFHVVTDSITTADLKEGQTLETLRGKSIQVSLDEDGQLRVNGVAFGKTNIEASNGVIHIINKVMKPASQQEKMVMKQ